jgi:Kef-type K+ transport system membrane component KefB
VQFDARALVRDPAGLAEVPLFLLALLVVRAVPAFAYARRFGRRRAGVAGLMQATSLTFVIVATQIGIASGLISRAVGSALLAAGLLSAALFPAVALKMLKGEPADADSEPVRSGSATAPVGSAEQAASPGR